MPHPEPNQADYSIPHFFHPNKNFFLSFGVLVLSSFTPTHIFGLTVSAGLGAAFVFAMLLQSRKRRLLLVPNFE